MLDVGCRPSGSGVRLGEGYFRFMGSAAASITRINAV